MLWRGVVFHPFQNNAVESAFADQRTYLYKGKEVDKQVHLGFDLASFAGTPIVAANRGKVLYADELGIYGNCVIVDHGMGLQSLYAHLSSIEVKAGQDVEKEQTLGRSGMTGLAGGDHLHFTMLVNGHMVNPVEWWDSHWIEDRILRKLRGGPGGTVRMSFSETCSTASACRRGAGVPAAACGGGASGASRDHAAAERQTCGRSDGRQRDGQGHVRRHRPREPRRSSSIAIRRARSSTRTACAPDIFVVSSGGLENVFVYVKDGLGDYYFETPTTAVTLDQKGCHYTPHVFGVRAGQPLEIVNSDPTLHNVNAMAKVNQSFNLGQAIQGMKNQKVFKAPEVMVHIKCDVHNWMNAYAGVLESPVPRGDGRAAAASS